MSKSDGVIHPYAYLERGVDHALVDRGTDVWYGASIMRHARVGKDCTIGQGAHIGRGVIVGNGCKVQNGAQLFEGVTLEDDVFIGPHVVFTNVKVPRARVSRKDQFVLTRVCLGASIGANATIVCGVTIGAFAMVGAGTVVTNDVRPYEIVVGNPSRNVGWSCRCGERLPDHFECLACHARYKATSIGLEPC